MVSKDSQLELEPAQPRAVGSASVVYNVYIIIYIILYIDVHMATIKFYPDASAPQIITTKPLFQAFGPAKAIVEQNNTNLKALAGTCRQICYTNITQTH